MDQYRYDWLARGLTLAPQARFNSQLIFGALLTGEQLTARVPDAATHSGCGIEFHLALVLSRLHPSLVSKPPPRHQAPPALGHSRP